MHCVAMFNMIRRFCWYNFCTFWLQDVFLKEQHQVIEFVLLQKHYSWELVPLMSRVWFMPTSAIPAWFHLWCLSSTSCSVPEPRLHLNSTEQIEGRFFSESVSVCVFSEGEKFAVMFFPSPPLSGRALTTAAHWMTLKLVHPGRKLPALP